MGEVNKKAYEVSPFTGEVYGIKRVCDTWDVPRSSYYNNKKGCVKGNQKNVSKKRGPKTKISDEELLGTIKEDIESSPFKGEGHRKIHARIRNNHHIKVGKTRVLRIMRENNLLSPYRMIPKDHYTHEGTIVTDTPNVMWATDGFRVFTAQEGWVWGFIVVEHWNAECLGLHICKKGDRFNALEPLSQALKNIYGSIDENCARGLALRMDNGSQFRSNHYQNQLYYWGIASSFSFVRQPETNGVAERFIRTLKEQAIYGKVYNNTEELRYELWNFVHTYNKEWLIAKNNYKAPLTMRNDYDNMIAA